MGSPSLVGDGSIDEEPLSEGNPRPVESTGAASGAEVMAEVPWLHRKLSRGAESGGDQ